MTDDSRMGSGTSEEREGKSVRLPVARLAMVARWKPVHLGHAAVLRGLSDQAEHALIGIGSSNQYSRDNPFTAKETAAMIRRVLAGRDNYSLFEVPDLGNGPKWRILVRDLIEAQLETLGGPLGAFVTANDYVRSLMQGLYPTVHPVELVAPRDRTRLSGTEVRQAMLDENHLVDRFRREFPATASAGLAESPQRS
jgi:nicotinamide-nucleotide adenylyltransferase